MKEAKIRYITLAMIAVQMISIFLVKAYNLISTYKEIKFFNDNDYSDITKFLLFFMAAGVIIVISVYFKIVFYFLLILEVVMTIILANIMVNYLVLSDIVGLSLFLLFMLFLFAPLKFFYFSMRRQQNALRNGKAVNGK